MQTNSSMCMRRVRINVMGVVLSINDRRKRVSGRGLCEPFTKKCRNPEAYSQIAYGKLCARLFNYLIWLVRVMVEGRGFG